MNTMIYLKFQSVKRAITGILLAISAIWIPFIIASFLPPDFANDAWYGIPMVISMLVYGLFGVGFGCFLVIDGCTDFGIERRKFISDHTPVNDRRRGGGMLV